jgi:hypothetical protein
VDAGWGGVLGVDRLQRETDRFLREELDYARQCKVGYFRWRLIAVGASCSLHFLDEAAVPVDPFHVVGIMRCPRGITAGVREVEVPPLQFLVDEVPFDTLAVIGAIDGLLVLSQIEVGEGEADLEHGSDLVSSTLFLGDSLFKVSRMAFRAPDVETLGDAESLGDVLKFCLRQ